MFSMCWREHLFSASRGHVDPHTRIPASCTASMSQGSMERQLSCSTVIRTHPLMNSCHKKWG
uniref:Uncharacterized protein n=1 Tax=Anguilla anguilla TaxID=7936 RepID=A0A0E9RAG5_ANGAN